MNDKIESQISEIRLLSDIAKNDLQVAYICFASGYKHKLTFFYGWGSTASRLEPFPEGSLLFTTEFPEIPGTHFIDL